MQTIIKEVIREHNGDKEALAKTAQEFIAAAHLLAAYCGSELCEHCVLQQALAARDVLENVLG